ncbi:pyocin knob domain-containing protein [Bacillus testis]|uniref:pyocin knob domain-containing protein n=1 Tax=Bacillus testis TaxID=1622072 RepID=UPI00067F2369|nr:pyocin knob domain-containing protein [Bacillus testis]
MAFPKLDKISKLIANLPDLPNYGSAGMSAAELKQYWDAPPEELRKFINSLIDALNKPSAASNIGAAQIEELTGSTVQELLVALKSYSKGLSLKLDGHTADNSKHITDEERARWNASSGIGDGTTPIGAATKEELRQVDNKIGPLANLTTNDKSNVVNAINEVKLTATPTTKKYAGNLDDLISNGSYTCDSSNTTSLPFSDSRSERPWLVQVIADKDTTGAKQIASQAISGDEIYHRTRTISGSWFPWQKVVDSRLIISGDVVPEGKVTASPGTLYLRTSGGSTTTTLYIKTNGTGNTGWTAK